MRVRFTRVRAAADLRGEAERALTVIELEIAWLGLGLRLGLGLGLGLGLRLGLGYTQPGRRAEHARGSARVVAVGEGDASRRDVPG